MCEYSEYSEYSASSCKLYRDYSKEDYSNLKIYKLVSDKYERCYIGMCCNDLVEELKWLKEQYVYWSYGGGYVNMELYDLMSVCGVLSMELIKCVSAVSFEDGLMYLNEVLKLYIDNGCCVNSRLWSLKSEKRSDDIRRDLRTSNMGSNYEYKNNKLEENKFKKDVRYVSGKIYKITSSNSELCYIGSTVRDLKSRLSVHISKYKNYKNNIDNSNKVCYISSYKILECGGKIDIVLLEDVKCENKYDLEKRESEYIIENIDVCVNECVPYKSMLNEFNSLRGINRILKEKVVKDCNNGKLYRLESVSSGKYYIGSTCLELDVCLDLYKKEYEKFKYGLCGTKRLMYDILKDVDVSISLICDLKSVCNKDLKLKEKEYIKALKDKNCINIKDVSSA